MKMIPSQLVNELETAFSSSDLFPSRFVNDRAYLGFYRLHARVLGLLARAGARLGFIPDIGRRFPIDPITRAKQRQLQAEADVAFINPQNQEVIALLDYETSDAAISKMRDKFNYLRSFAAHTSTVQVVGLFVTVTDVLHGWCPETRADRESFAEDGMNNFACSFHEHRWNGTTLLLAGTFFPDHLRLRFFEKGAQPATHQIFYGDAKTPLAGKVQ